MIYKREGLSAAKVQKWREDLLASNAKPPAEVAPIRNAVKPAATPRPQVKNGRHPVMLLAGATDRDHRNLKAKLAERGIELRFHCFEMRRMRAVPPACDAVIVATDFIEHEFSRVVQLRADEADVPVIPGSVSWVALEPTLERYGWIGPDDKPLDLTVKRPEPEPVVVEALPDEPGGMVLPAAKPPEPEPREEKPAEMTAVAPQVEAALVVAPEVLTNGVSHGVIADKAPEVVTAVDLTPPPFSPPEARAPADAPTIPADLAGAVGRFVKSMRVFMAAAGIKEITITRTDFLITADEEIPDDATPNGKRDHNT